MVHMIRSFAGQGTEDIYRGLDTKAARRVCPRQIWNVAQRKLEMLNAVSRLQDLKVPPSNQLEKLARDRAGQWAIRVNDQFRFCFRWEGTDAFEVEITDYH